MKLRSFLFTIIAAILPIAALTSCGEAEAKHQYEVAMTGVV